MDSTYYYGKDMIYGNHTREQARKLKIGTYYLLAIEPSRLIDDGKILYNGTPGLHVMDALPPASPGSWGQGDNVFDIIYTIPPELAVKIADFSVAELSEEAYKEALRAYDDKTNVNTNSAKTIKIAWETYGHIVEADKKENNDNTTIIFTTGFAIIFIGIIAVGIILAKRSKSTPSGTPPTVDKIEPDAPDTPEAETQATEQPDVTEPPDPPKEE